MMTASLRRTIANFAGFQMTWFASVGGAGLGYPLLGPLVAALWLSLHLARIDADRRDAAGGSSAGRSEGEAAGCGTGLARSPRRTPIDGADGRRPTERGIELRLLGAAAVVGYGFDSVLVLAGSLAFPDHAGPAAPTTLWMVVLWTAFAATLRHSLHWTRRRYVLSVVAGAVFGPLAYVAGEKLGAIALATPPAGWLAVAGAWGIAMPLLLWLRERIDIAPGAARGGTPADDR